MFRIGKGARAEQSSQNPGQKVGQNSEQNQSAAPPPAPTGSTPPSTSPVHHPSIGEQHATPAPIMTRSERPASTSRAVTESESLARDIKDGVVSGFVGSGTTLTGEANFKGMLRVDGHLSGRVYSDKGTLIISSGGHVEANVEVAAAKINGTINGDIIATERIEMGRSAHVTGNIETPVLVVEQGAVFEGSCRMTQAKAASSGGAKGGRRDELFDEGVKRGERIHMPEDAPAPADAVSLVNVAN
ncbi:MAG: polymer-forming cytoskeletal protein [Pyrinomonadaceae bacterium]|nr:polymer-forming cytoskeletal protein [Pyrinomonadaceae bacterium]